MSVIHIQELGLDDFFHLAPTDNKYETLCGVFWKRYSEYKENKNPPNARFICSECLKHYTHHKFHSEN